jgi:DNA polymerase V
MASRSAAHPEPAPATSGFPSPADGSAEASLDLCDLLVRHPAATFYLRMRGDAQVSAGISAGDILVVDRSLTPSPGRLVIVAEAGALRVARWPAQPVGAARDAQSAQDAAGETLLWGVVTYVIHQTGALPTGRPPLPDARELE